MEEGEEREIVLARLMRDIERMTRWTMEEWWKDRRRKWKRKWRREKKTMMELKNHQSMMMVGEKS